LDNDTLLIDEVFDASGNWLELVRLWSAGGAELAVDVGEVKFHGQTLD